MADIDVSFGAVTLPSGASATLTVYEDTDQDGTAENQDSASLSDGTTSYIVSGFDGGTGNDYWWDVEPSHSDITADNVVSAPVDLTIPDATSTILGSAAILGDGEVTADTEKVVNSSSSMLANGEVTASGLGRVTSSASVLGDGEVDATSLSGIFGDVSILGDGEVDATADIVIRNWLIDGTPFANVDVVESTAKSIKLSGIAARYRLKQLRRFRRDAEKVGVVIDDEGRFRAVDRSLDGNTYTVTPPISENPPHVKADMLVAGYNESRAAKQENKKNVEVTLQRPESRDATGGEPSETAGSTEWLFEFHSGTIATDRVTPEQETAVDVAEDVESLQLVLTAEQVLVLETSASYPDAVSVVEVPDGENLAEDNSSADRQTVTVTAPSPAKEDVLASGDYVVVDWTSTRLDSDSYEVTLDLRPKA